MKYPYKEVLYAQLHNTGECIVPPIDDMACNNESVTDVHLQSEMPRNSMPRISPFVLSHQDCVNFSACVILLYVGHPNSKTIETESHISTFHI